MKQTQLINSATKLAQQRIYVNSFTQRILGDDIQYTVSLGRPFEIKHSIQLDQCVLENLFGNFYQSKDGDYRDLTIIDQTGAYVKIFVDQYISSLQVLKQFLDNSWPDHSFEITQLSYTQSISIRVKNTIFNTYESILLIGYGWNKLGFRQQQPDDEPSSLHVASNFCDLSQPSAFLISIDNIPFSISSQNGSAAFCIPNTSSFGSKNIYLNTQQSTCQTIYVQNPITVSQLNITIQGCDQMPLNTIRSNNQFINQTNSEHIFLFTIQ